MEKLRKYKKLVLLNNETSREKIKPKIINLSKCQLNTRKSCSTTNGNVFDIRSDTTEFSSKLKLIETILGIEYNDENLVINKSNINVNTAIPELSIFQTY